MKVSILLTCFSLVTATLALPYAARMFIHCTF
jgi:hypothetical protein